MPTLSSCIRRAGKALDVSDASAIREIAREYLGDGLTNSEAATKAIEDYLGVLAAERSDLVSQLAEAGGDVGPYAGGIAQSNYGQQQASERATLRRSDAQRRESAGIAAQELESQESARVRDPKVRYGLTDAEVEQVTRLPADMDSASIRFAMTSEEMSKRDTDASLFQRLRESAAIDKTNDVGRRATTALVPTRNLVDFLTGEAKAIAGRINRLNKTMAGRESALTKQAHNVIDPWIDLHKGDRENSDLLTGVMQRATLARVDPSEEFDSKQLDALVARVEKLQQAIASGAKGSSKLGVQLNSARQKLKAQEERRTNHAQLARIFDTLPQSAKDVYVQTRDMFRNQYDILQESMTARIESLEADAKTKQALRAMIEKTFESGKIDPYFPLSRYGKYWAVAKEQDGEVAAYSQFDSTSERDRWASNQAKKGYDIRTGEDGKAGKNGSGPKIAAVDPGFTLNVVQGVRNLQTASSAETNNLIDDIWQTYLQSLPELSARKQFIHRKGVVGFTGDGLRSVADASLRNSRRIAKVEHQYQIENEVAALREEAGKTASDDSWITAVADEVQQRHDWNMDHVSSPIASVLTSLGFHNYLALLRPSAAIVNLTQTALVGLPTLTAFASGKPGNAFVELSRSAKDVVTLMRLNKDPYADAEINKRFSAEDVQALADIEERFAVFDKTRTHDLIGLQDGGSSYATSRFAKWAEVSGWLFHNTEVFNRKHTALAAYRLARKQGMEHDDAVYRSVQLTEDTHFDYSSQNRPRILQSDAARVALLFRNYSINMYQYLIRNFHDGIRGQGTPQQRREARIRFYGTMGTTSVLSGAAGWPLVWALGEALDSMYEWAIDEPEDMEAIIDLKTNLRMTIREAFGEEYGDEMAAFIMDGAIDAIPFAVNQNSDLNVPNPTFSTRMSLANVAFQDAPADAPIGSDKWQLHYAGELAGPSIGMVLDWIQAGREVSQGGGLRAVEQAMPATISDIMKTMRYAEDGVKTKAGGTVIEGADLKASDYATQLGGFTPYALTRQYEENRGRRYYQQRQGLRAEGLRNRLKNAVKGNGGDIDEVMADIRTFNQNFPGFAIDMRRTIRNVNTIDNRMLDGLRTTRRQRPALEEIEVTGDN